MASVVVVGGTNVDIKARTTRPLVAATSNPGHTVLAPGGVGRNIAEGLARLGDRVRLVSIVGDDPLGDLVLEATSAAGVDVTAVRRRPGRTGTYTAVLDHDGELVAGVADMALVDTLAPADLDDVLTSDGDGPDLVVLDGNLGADTVTAALDRAGAAGIPVVVEPVSVPKAARLAPALHGRRLLAITPNADELAALGGLDRCRDHADLVWVRRGATGSTLVEATGSTELDVVPLPEPGVVDVTGAGDAMLAAFCHALLAGEGAVDAARLGHAAAALTVASPHTVRPDLSLPLLRSLLP